MKLLCGKKEFCGHKLKSLFRSMLLGITLLKSKSEAPMRKKEFCGHKLKSLFRSSSCWESQAEKLVQIYVVGNHFAEKQE